ncbi:MerR family DNA-binding transcriptional regulator [Streptacidiphilus sp. EB103A]|uniref:DNA polymerase III subunit beta family protein n=1 Tax=Streptacidiphilus sp. EB103A TaxID=3156275 RepID=UPI0035197C96
MESTTGKPQQHLLSIGEMARASGLTVSALRFYDGAGVLLPVQVDPGSGYRWYGPEQRAEARLRRVGVPLADLRLILAGWAGEDTALVGKLLDAHLLRLQNGLDDARRELSAVRDLLALREHHMSDTGSTGITDNTGNTAPVRLALDAEALAAAVDAVRFAVSTDPELPMLGGVCFDVDPEERALRLVATDRYRLALAQVPLADGTSPAAKQVLVPAALVDAARALLGSGGEAVLTLDQDRISLEAGGSQAGGTVLDHDFPDYRRLTRLSPGRRVLVDVPALRAALATADVHSRRREQDGGDFDIAVLGVSPEGALTVVNRQDRPADHFAVNREFLLDALAATARDQLVLELGGPVAPLAVRLPDGAEAGCFSVLMPVRLDDE